MIIRLCLCIPTYNNSQTIETVIQSCLQNTEFPILVIDDGSTKPVKDIISVPEVHEALRSGRLRILRLEQNSGKGAALRLAVNDCVRNTFTHLFAIDGDGQHLASEIPKLVDLAQEHPWDLIIGARKLDASTVPGATKFGRAFSNFWVNYQTGTPIQDSQSGFRLYPLFHLQNMSFWTRKFDFEIEVLIRLIWKGVTIRETEIAVFYPPKGERVTHFHKFWDNARLSILNTALVIIAMLKSHRSKTSAGLSLGLGVWIGCTPLFGFHTLIALAFAAIFPLNAVMLLLGSQISIPPLIPLLVFASILIGAQVAPGYDQAIHYVVGSIVLGALLCAVIVLGSILVSRSILKRESSSVTWNGHARGGKFGNWILKQVTRYLGLRAAYACLLFVVPYFYIFAPKARRSINEYWKIVSPQMGLFARQIQILRHFYGYAQVLLDSVCQSFHKQNIFVVNAHGIENIAQAFHTKEGAILLTAHVGGWDLGASLLEKEHKLSEEFHIVQYQSSKLNFEKLKESTGTQSRKNLFIEQGSLQSDPHLIFKIRELLDMGLPVGLMGDRPLGNHYELIPFFGKLAPFDVTAFRIAAACKRPILFSFGFKGKGSTYDFYANDLRFYNYSQSSARALQCYGWATEYVEVLEEMLKRYPLAWYNFFPFWSSVPTSPIAASLSTRQNYLREAVSKPAMWPAESEFVPRAIVE